MKTILSIDGGGIRGIIPAAILAELERRTGKPVAGQFDLIAGTSTGAVLALGLSCPGAAGRPAHSAADMLQLYCREGSRIFARPLLKTLGSAFGLGDERYSEQPLEAVLRRYLGSATLGDCLTRVLITAYDIENRNPFFFKSWRPECMPVEAWRAARASSAAPTYFEPVQVGQAGNRYTLIDGGVFVNNPAMCAYAEMVRLETASCEMLLVSLGTGQLTRPIPYADARTWGKLQWAVPMLDVVFDGVGDAVDYQLRHILGADSYVRFQTELDKASDDLDCASRENCDLLLEEAAEILRQNDAAIDMLCARLADRQVPA